MTIYNITTGKTYESIAAAARATGVSASSIARASQKETRSAGGYQWARASTAAEKRAASRAAHKAAGALSEAQRERREWQRKMSEARIKERKAAEKRAKEQAAEAERQRKAAERERKRAEREHKQAVADARRAIKALKRKAKEANLSNQVAGMIDAAISEIDVSDYSELEGFDTATLQQIFGRAEQTFDSIAAIEGKEDIGRLQLLFGIRQSDAERMQGELRKLLSLFGEIREFVTSTQGEAGYAAINLRGEYQQVVVRSNRYTQQNLQDLIVNMKSILEEAKQKNELTAYQIHSTISSWASEVGYGHKKPREPLKPRR